MIVRVWRAVARAERSDAYLAYFGETGQREYLATPGFRGLRILRRPVPDGVEWVLMTTWESWDAIRAFAGPNPELAVYYPDDADYFVELPEHVEHYELLLDAVPDSG